MKNINFRYTENPWWVVVFLYFICVGVKIFYIYPTSGPVIFGDELLHRDFAERIFRLQAYNPELLSSSSRYPPIYPMLLSPAFWFSQWYDGMVFINILISSAMLFPVYLISRKLLSNNWSLLPVIISATLPFHAVYPGLLMAENVLMPFFLFALYFVIFHENQTPHSSLFMGILLAICFLTKYLFLPAALIFGVLWIIKFCDKPFRIKKIITHTLLLSCGVAIIIIPWVYYSVTSGFPIKFAFGAAEYRVKEFTPPLSKIPFWGAYYGSYLLLMASPYLVLLFSLTLAPKKTLAHKTLFVSVGILTVAYLSMATYHSWGVYYNYPTPGYLLGRYLIYFEPITIIFGIYGLRHLSLETTLTSNNKPLVFLFTGTSLVITFVAYGILYKSWLEPLPPWFATLNFNSPNTAALTSQTPWIMVISTICFSSFFALKRSIYLKNLITKTFPLLLIIQTSFSLVEMHKRTSIPSPISLHARKISNILLEKISSTHEFTLCLADGTQNIDPAILQNGLRFWSFSKASVIRSSLPQKSPTTYKLSTIKTGSDLAYYHLNQEIFYISEK